MRARPHAEPRPPAPDHPPTAGMAVRFARIWSYARIVGFEARYSGAKLAVLQGVLSAYG